MVISDTILRYISLDNSFKEHIQVFKTIKELSKVLSPRNLNRLFYLQEIELDKIKIELMYSYECPCGGHAINKDNGHVICNHCPRTWINKEVNKCIH